MNITQWKYVPIIGLYRVYRDYWNKEQQYKKPYPEEERVTEEDMLREIVTDEDMYKAQGACLTALICTFIPIMPLLFMLDWLGVFPSH